MIVPNRTIRPHIVIQAARYQVKNQGLASASSHLTLTLSEASSFRKAHDWCRARNCKMQCCTAHVVRSRLDGGAVTPAEL